MPNPTILAIDPGPEKSGYVIWSGTAVLSADVISNHDMRELILLCTSCNPAAPASSSLLAIEQIGHFGSGMPAGKSVFETCIWIGRFIECWSRNRLEKDVRLVLRPTIKTHLCGTPKAKDSNVTRAVRDRVGGKGTKRSPGPTHGVTSHAISALALALYVADMERIAA